MSTGILIIIIPALLIFLNALYVGAEFAAVSARKTRIIKMADDGNWLAKMIMPTVSDSQKLDHYIAGCQLGITVTSLALGAYGQSTVARYVAPLLANLGDLAQPVALSLSATIILIVFTILQVIMGELFPKSIAIQYPEKTALVTALPMRWTLVILRPFIWFFNGSGALILKLMGVSRSEGDIQVHTPGEIELLVSDSHEGGLIDDKKQQMLRNALRLRELTARQVMVPRTRMVAASIDDSPTQVLTAAIQSGFTRIPIYADSIDNITGFIHIKELFPLYLQEEKSLKEILREVIYVPETMPVLDLWQTLNLHRQYMAVVFDEYGGTDGMVTFEDLLEEIFGELEDEFDQEMPEMYYYDSLGRTHLRGDLLVADINEYLHLDLPVEETDTLGGLIFSLLGRPPEEGDEVEAGGLLVRVEKVEDQSVTELSFKMPDSGPAPQVDEWEVAPHE